MDDEQGVAGEGPVFLEVDKERWESGEHFRLGPIWQSEYGGMLYPGETDDWGREAQATWSLGLTREQADRLWFDLGRELGKPVPKEEM